MTRISRMLRLLALVGAMFALVANFLLFVRPWYLRWGATPEESRRVLPGDEILPNAAEQETRAITISANTASVWSWLAQIGQDRGGFYSFDLLENLVGCEMPTQDRLRPDRQDWKLGDRLWMYPVNKAGGIGFATLRAYHPGQALGFATRRFGTTLSKPEDGSWSFVLEPIDEKTTRLLMRGRGAAGRSLMGVAFDRLLFEPVHFVMERRMMASLKELAEGRERNRLENHVQVALWTIAFGLFLTAGALTLSGVAWPRPLLGFVGAGIVFQVLTLGQPPIAMGILLVVGVVLLLWWPTRRKSVSQTSGLARRQLPVSHAVSISTTTGTLTAEPRL